MNVYIAGPMAGRPGLNRAAFDAMEDELTRRGHCVYNPAKLVGSGMTRDQCLAYDLRALASIGADGMLATDAVVFLDGWSESEGAFMERAVAEALGIPCHSVAEAMAGAL